MEIILGAAVLCLGLYRLVCGIDKGVHAMQAGYQRRAAEWRTNNPTGIRATRVAGALATVWHGARPGWRAFKAEWLKNWREDRDRIRARFEPVTVTSPGPAVPPQPKPAAPTTVPVTAPAPQPVAPAAPAAGAPALTVLEGGLSERTPVAATTASGLNPTTTMDRISGKAPMNEITSIPDLHREGIKAQNAAAAEREGLGANVRRYDAAATEANLMAEAATRLLDNDVDAAAAYAALSDAWSHVASLQAATAAAYDQVVAAASSAVAHVAPHAPLAEARAVVGSKASSQTDAYRTQ
jgi:hypothetical protein